MVAGSFILQTVEAGNPWVQSIGYTILGFFFLSLILKVVTAKLESNLRFLFQAKWLRSLGKYSYALYIFQMPILVAVKRLLPGSALGRLIESPFQLAMVSSLIAHRSYAIDYHGSYKLSFVRKMVFEIKNIFLASNWMRLELLGHSS